MTQSQTLNFGRDVQGYNAYAPYPSANKYAAVLTLNTAVNFTVPSSAQNWILAFAYTPGAIVWVDFSGAAAVVPSAGSFTGVTVELLPASRQVKAGDSISVVSGSSTAAVGVMLYAV